MRKSKLLPLALGLIATTGLTSCGFNWKTMSFTFTDNASEDKTSSDENKTSGDKKDDSATTSKFKTPTKDTSYWQDYTKKKYYEEDFSTKTVAYQFVLKDAELSSRKYQVLINLYEDGEFVINQYYDTEKSQYFDYYGYWANMNDENIYAGITYYSSSLSGYVYGIDYSYNLTKTGDAFDTFGINLAMGFAEGGVYVRNVNVSGNGEVTYKTVADYEKSIGATRSTKAAYQEAPAGGDDTTGGDTTTKKALFAWTSDSENYLLTFNSDCTYVFEFKTASLIENGTWSFENWEMKIKNSKDEEIAATLDSTTHTFSLNYVSGISDLVKKTFTVESSVWGPALGSSGSYSNDKTLFAWTSDSENYLLTFNSDCTYVFEFKTASLIENGTWSFENWEMKIKNSKDEEIAATLDSTTHTFSLNYVSGISDLVKKTFTVESSVWGPALGSSGSYTAK